MNNDNIYFEICIAGPNCRAQWRGPAMQIVIYYNYSFL